MVKIKLLLLALLFAAIPNFLWAYTKDKVVTFEGLSYKGVSPKTQLQAYPLKHTIS